MNIVYICNIPAFEIKNGDLVSEFTPQELKGKLKKCLPLLRTVSLYQYEAPRGVKRDVDSCMVCLDETDESVFVCGHALHVDCGEGVTRCFCGETQFSALGVGGILPNKAKKFNSILPSNYSMDDLDSLIETCRQLTKEKFGMASIVVPPRNVGKKIIRRSKVTGYDIPMSAVKTEKPPPPEEEEDA